MLVQSFDYHLGLHNSQTPMYGLYLIQSFDYHLGLHNSQTSTLRCVLSYLFDYHLGLHNSQTSHLRVFTHNIRINPKQYIIQSYSIYTLNTYLCQVYRRFHHLNSVDSYFQLAIDSFSYNLLLYTIVALLIRTTLLLNLQLPIT